MLQRTRRDSLPAAGGRRVQRRNRLVRSHQRLVAPVARHYARQCAESREDLEQVGSLGLIRAAELYRAASGVPFSAYARRHIRGAILHYLRDAAPLVRPPRQLQERRLQLARAEAALLGQLGRPPQAEELRQAIGLSAVQWRRMLESAGCGQRLWLAPEALALLPAPESPDQPEPDPRLEGLRQLPADDRRVLEQVVLRGRSLREVAGQLGVSAATVHRRLHRGLAELRRRVGPPSAAPGC